MKMILIYVEIPKFYLKIDECEWMRGFGEGFLDFLNAITQKKDFSTQKFKSYEKGYIAGYKKALEMAKEGD